MHCVLECLRRPLHGYMGNGDVYSYMHGWETPVYIYNSSFLFQIELTIEG